MSENIINKKIEDISARNLRSYKEQYWYGENFLKDFLELEDVKNLNILEVGTAEAGLLKYFSELGHNCYGVEYSKSRFENSVLLNEGLKLNLSIGDVCKAETMAHLKDINFDVIIIRDVIEHVESKTDALINLKNLLSDDGKLFISFPPKYSPYAGHQQVIPNKLAKLPYLYILPNFLYKSYLNILRIDKKIIDGILYIKNKRVSLKFFNNLFKQLGFRLIKQKFFLIRPSHESRYKMKRIGNEFGKIFPLNEIFTTGALYILSKEG